MSAVSEGVAVPLHDPGDGFVDEGGRLECVPAALGRHLSSRDPPEVFVDQRDRLLEGTFVPGAPAPEQFGHTLLWGYQSVAHI